MQAHAPPASSARVWTTPFLVTLLAMMSLQVSNLGSDTSDSIMALDLDTGKVRWVFQAEPNDATSADVAQEIRAKRARSIPVPTGTLEHRPF